MAAVLGIKLFRPISISSTSKEGLQVLGIDLLGRQLYLNRNINLFSTAIIVLIVSVPELMLVLFLSMFVKDFQLNGPLTHC